MYAVFTPFYNFQEFRKPPTPAIGGVFKVKFFYNCFKIAHHLYNVFTFTADSDSTNQMSVMH